MATDAERLEAYHQEQERRRNAVGPSPADLEQHFQETLRNQGGPMVEPSVSPKGPVVSTPPPPVEAGRPLSLPAKAKRSFGQRVERAIFPFGRGPIIPKVLEGADWYQRNVTEPVNATFSAAQLPSPGIPGVADRGGFEWNPEQLPWERDWRQRYRESVPLGGRILGEMFTDPLNLVPGVGFTKMDQLRRLGGRLGLRKAAGAERVAEARRRVALAQDEVERLTAEVQPPPQRRLSAGVDEVIRPTGEVTVLSPQSDDLMRDWIRDAFPERNPMRWETDRLTRFIDANYAGGLKQFLDDSPELLGARPQIMEGGAAAVARQAEFQPSASSAVSATQVPITPPQAGAIQAGMGIGEPPSQGTLGLAGQEGISRPLIDAEQVAERQRLAAERAAGQAGLPEGLPPQGPPAGGPPPPPAGIPPGDVPPFASQIPPTGGSDAVAWFRDFLTNPRRIEDWDLTGAMRTQERGQRAVSFQAEVDRLIGEGYGSEMAVQKATRELAGSLPTVATGIQQVVTPVIRTALFDEVKRVLSGPHDAYELVSTSDALFNALAGRAIPRTPGAQGGSAYSRLVRVFGGEIAKAISQRQTLDEVLTLRSGKRGLQTTMGPERVRGPGEAGTPGPFINQPPTQTFGTAQMIGERQVFGRLPTERLIAETLPLGQPQVPLISERPGPVRSALVPDLRTPAQQELDRVAFEKLVRTGEGPSGLRPYPSQPSTQQALNPPVPQLIPEKPPGPFQGIPADLRSQGEREIDLQVFREVTSGGEPPTGPREPRLPRAGDLPPDNIIKQSVFLTASDKEKLIRLAKAAGMTAVDLGNLLRANVASVDLSYLRQQAFLIPAHPVALAKSIPDSLKAMWSKEYAQGIDRSIKSHPYYAIYEAGLKKNGRDFLRALDSKVAKAWEREEQFLVLGGDRPLQRLAQKIPWLNISNRAFVTGINKMNWDIYVHYVDTLQDIQQQILAGTAKLTPNEAISVRKAARVGVELVKDVLGVGKPQLGDFFSVQKSADNLASLLADMSGRGPLGPLREMSPALNAAFFSVRLNIGRLLSPRHLVSGDPFVRRAAWRNFTTAIGTFSGLLFAGQQMGLWDLETDPRSSDFMKLRLGRLRVDLWGGYQQFAVLYGRLLPVVGGIKSTQTGEVSDYDPIKGGAQFLRSKAAPLVGEVLTAWTSKDFKGSPIDRADWKRWLKDNMPFAVQDVFESFEAEGLVGLFAGVPAGVVGAGLYGQPPSLNDVAQELYRMSYSDLPTKGAGAAARKRVRAELVKRLSERERQLETQRKKDIEQRGKEREKKRQRKFGSGVVPFRPFTPSPSPSSPPERIPLGVPSGPGLLGQ